MSNLYLHFHSRSKFAFPISFSLSLTILSPRSSIARSLLTGLKMHSYFLLLSFAALVAARTDLSGCVSSETVAYGGAACYGMYPAQERSVASWTAEVDERR